MRLKLILCINEGHLFCSHSLESSLVDVDRGGGLPREQLVVVEPKSNLALGRVIRVAAVNDVATDINAKVT